MARTFDVTLLVPRLYTYRITADSYKDAEVAVLAGGGTFVDDAPGGAIVVDSVVESVRTEPVGPDRGAWE